MLTLASIRAVRNGEPWSLDEVAMWRSLTSTWWGTYIVPTARRLTLAYVKVGYPAAGGGEEVLLCYT